MNSEQQQIIKFLCGEDALDGLWFGEAKEKGNQFWWREKLREAFSTLPESSDEIPLSGLSLADLIALMNFMKDFNDGKFNPDLAREINNRISKINFDK